MVARHSVGSACIVVVLELPHRLALYLPDLYEVHRRPGLLDCPPIEVISALKRRIETVPFDYVLRPTEAALGFYDTRPAALQTTSHFQPPVALV